MTIYQDAMDTFLGQSDPQMDRLAEAISHCLTSGLVNLRSPIVFRNQMSAGPAMIFLQEGGSPVSIATIMPSNQYSMLGVGVGNEGIVANELVAHPAWSLSGLAAHMGYGNAGTGYPVGYGGGPGGVPIRPANGPFGQQVGGGGGGSGMGPGAGGFAPGQGLVPGLGAFGVPGGLGWNGGRVAGGGGGVGQVESESLGTGYNLPGTQADYPDGGSGNPAHMPAEHVPIGNMGMMLQNVRPTYKVKTTTAHDSGETETVNVYVGVPGSETDSGLELEAYNRFGDLADDEWAIAVWIDNRWELAGGGGGGGCEAANAIIHVTVGGSPTGGTFDWPLTVGGTTDTMTFNWNSTAAQAQTELETHTNISSGDVSVSGGPFPTAVMAIEFTGNLANTPIAIPVAAYGSLTGGSGFVISHYAQMGFAG